MGQKWIWVGTFILGVTTSVVAAHIYNTPIYVQATIILSIPAVYLIYLVIPFLKNNATIIEIISN